MEFPSEEALEKSYSLALFPCKGNNVFKYRKAGSGTRILGTANRTGCHLFIDLFLLIFTENQPCALLGFLAQKIMHETKWTKSLASP